jgi:hypothetical protein
LREKEFGISIILLSLINSNPFRVIAIKISAYPLGLMTLEASL